MGIRSELTSSRSVIVAVLLGGRSITVRLLFRRFTAIIAHSMHLDVLGIGLDTGVAISALVIFFLCATVTFVCFISYSQHPAGFSSLIMEMYDIFDPNSPQERSQKQTTDWIEQYSELVGKHCSFVFPSFAVSFLLISSFPSSGLFDRCRWGWCFCAHSCSG